MIAAPDDFMNALLKTLMISVVMDARNQLERVSPFINFKHYVNSSY
jgi:hypothetical protein